MHLRYGDKTHATDLWRLCALTLIRSTKLTVKEENIQYLHQGPFNKNNMYIRTLTYSFLS